MNEAIEKTGKINHPTLILIRGVPGSGKSYLTIALQKAIGEDKVVTLDPDATDYSSEEYKQLSSSLIEQGVDVKFHPYRYLRARAHKAITSNKIIVWNQPFTHLEGFNKTAKNLKAFAAEHGTHLPILVVEVEVRPDIAKERVTQRREQGGHGPSEEVFTRFISDYVSFSDKGYTVVVVHGEDDVQVSVASVTKALAKLNKS